MKKPLRTVESPYMQWAKQHTHVQYNLAASGVMNYSLRMLPVHLEDLEITGDSYYGYAPLLQALSRHCGVPTDQIFCTIGTSLANHIAMASLIEPGDEILLEQPTYELLTSTASYLGARVRRFLRRKENHYRIEPSELTDLISPRTKLIVLTNLHNPSSALTEEMTLREIADAACSVHAKVLVDEVYLDAAFEHSPRSAIHLGMDFVITNSLTKVYGLSGLRCGWVLAEPELIRKMWLLNDLFDVIPPHPTEQLSVMAFQHLTAIRSWARSILDQNQKTVRELLLGRDDVECFAPGFGTVLFPRLRHGAVDNLYARAMDRYQTSIAPGRFFEEPDHFRIGLGLDPNKFRQGLLNVCRVLDELS